MDHLFKKEIQILKKQDLYRKLTERRGPQEKKLFKINLGSNDYLSLSSHPDLIENLIESIKEYGIGSTGSRYLSGNSSPHFQLENLISETYEQKGSLFFNSGYTANLGVITSLAKAGIQTILIDRDCHASIIDACRQTHIQWKVFQHNNMDHLKSCLKRYAHKKKTLIVSEALFSMDGQLSPLESLIQLSNHYESYLYIDEAHSWGLFHKKGLGRVSQVIHNLKEISPYILRLITFGKAGGSVGAVVIGETEVIEWIRQVARSSIYTTSLPPALINLNKEVFNKVIQSTEERKKIRTLHQVFLEKMQIKRDFFSPIIPIKVDPKNRFLLEKKLKKEGIYIPYMRYPTVKKKEEIFRVSLTSSIRPQNIELVSQIIKPFT